MLNTGLCVESNVGTRASLNENAGVQHGPLRIYAILVRIYSLVPACVILPLLRSDVRNFSSWLVRAE